MTLEGAINFNETNDYTVFTMNSANAGQYCVVLPKNNSGTYNMLVDLHMKSLFDEVNAGSRTKDDLINVIGEEYNKIKTKYNDAILVIPMFDEANYINIINNNDKQKMFDEVKKIGAITSELYKKLIDSGIDKQKIDQKIILLKKNEYDDKFVEWLTGQMPNFVSGVSMNEFNTVVDNPFVVNETPVNEVPNIFGEPVVAPVEPVVEAPVEAVVQPELVQEPVVQQPVVENSAVEVPNIFGEQPMVQPEPVVQPTPVQETIVQSSPVVQEPVVENSVVQEPQPVQNVSLNSAPVQQPVQNVVSAPVQPEVIVENQGVVQEENGEVDGQATRKSNGFVNLAVLLIVLGVVTVISIELGKFLYNTYGV